MSFHPVHDAEFGETRSDDLEVLDGGNLPQFCNPLYPALPTIGPPIKPRIARDRRVDFVSDKVNQDQCYLKRDQCYTPYRDYLGLCQELEYVEPTGRSELSPSSDISLSSEENESSPTDNLGLTRLSVVASRFDRLDQERLVALSEFDKNGTTYELDEYDIIQQKVRGQEPPTREIPVVPNDRIKEYLWHKQCKNAQMNVSQFQEQMGGKKKSKLICVFCKNNKEPQHVYTGHVLKDWRGYTVCPVLRKYPCPICQAIGDNAHTIKYCPLNNDSEFRTSPSPLRTSRMATGKKRRS